MRQRKALITGITGQDGAYLAKLLLQKGYKVHGAYRRSSTPNFWRLDELQIKNQVDLVCIELADQSSLQSAFFDIRPDEIYNLAAQSFVAESFTQPLYTTEIDGLSVTKILEAIRKFCPEAHFYQASTSEMFGKVQEIPQVETTPFYPRSPYGAAKLYAHWITVNYREAYSLYACSGILFNHESPLRGIEFVTRKITAGLAAIKTGAQDHIVLGNLDAQRDWGFAGDYVEGMWRMLRQDQPDDFVLATGVTVTIRRFAEMAAQALDMELVWDGEGLGETGIDRKTGKTLIRISANYYRPAEVDLLIGNPAKANKILGWTAHMQIPELVRLMADADQQRAAKEFSTTGRVSCAA